MYVVLTFRYNFMEIKISRNLYRKKIPNENTVFNVKYRYKVIKIKIPNREGVVCRA